MATDRLVLRSSDPTRVEFAYSTLPRNVLIYLNVVALYIYMCCFVFSRMHGMHTNHRKRKKEE